MSISIDGESSSSSTNTNPELDNTSIIACLGTESEQYDNSTNNNSKSDNSTNNNTNSDNSNNINSSSNIDGYFNNPIKTSSTNTESSQDDHSSNHNLNNNTEWKDYSQANTGYFNQFSFDPGLSSSESEGDYERICNAKKQYQLELEMKKKFHEESFENITPPNWKGMGLKRWNPNKIILRFYVQQLIDSNKYSIDDNRYNVCLKPNHKFKWYVYRTSAPALADVRKPFIIPDGVTNENLMDIIEEVYEYVVKFVKKYCLIRRCFQFSSESD